jgi:uncharacterized protein involved in outer membrane biogenesis
MRVAKIIGWVLSGVLGLLIIAAGAVWFGGTTTAVWAIEHPLSRMIGREIRIGGPLTIEWGAPTKIVAQDVHVANAGWSDQPEMFSAKRLEIDIFVRTLLCGPTHIPLVALDGSKLLLETSDHGDRNWDFGLKSAAPQKRHQFPNLEKLKVDGGELLYRNGETKAETDIGFAKLDVDAPDPGSPIKIATDGTFQQHPAHLSGTVGPLAELWDTAKPYPVKLDAGIDQIGLAAEGSIAEPLDFAGVDLHLSFHGAKLEELASLLGVPMPELPDFRGTAKLGGGNGDWMLEAFVVALGKSDLQGGISIDTNAKVPQLVAKLTSSTLDLADFKGVFGMSPPGGKAPAKTPDAGERVIPDTPIAVEKLPGLNADLTFDGTRIKSNTGVPFERVSLGLQLKDGALTVKPLRFHTADGDVDLNLHFTPFTTQGPPHLVADIDVRHIDLHKLLGGPTMPQIVKATGGSAGGFVKLDTVGVSLREFLAHMNGDAGIFMENGQVSQLLEQLAPLDVLGALGVYISGDKVVPINCLVSRFDIKSGVASATTLMFDTNDAEVVGSGNINFADETIFLTLTPYNKSFTSITLRTPVDVQGTFAKPTYHLKTGGLAARVGAAVGLGVLFPPAAVLALVDVGLGQRNACSKVYAAQRPPGNPGPAATTGSSAPQGSAQGTPPSR